MMLSPEIKAVFRGGAGDWSGLSENSVASDAEAVPCRPCPDWPFTIKVRVRPDEHALGLTFIGLGLFGILGRSDNDVRSLLWGSLSLCRWKDVMLMLGASTVLVAFVVIFQKEMRAILFSRQDAAAAGILTTPVWTGFLILTAIVMTVNFQTVGGLMIYSLITNPAAAAFQLVRGGAKTLALASILGAISGLGGFLISALTDLPSGAVIVLVSSLVVLLAGAWARIR